MIGTEREKRLKSVRLHSVSSSYHLSFFSFLRAISLLVMDCYSCPFVGRWEAHYQSDIAWHQVRPLLLSISLGHSKQFGVPSWKTYRLSSTGCCLRGLCSTCYRSFDWHWRLHWQLQFVYAILSLLSALFLGPSVLEGLIETKCAPRRPQLREKEALPPATIPLQAVLLQPLHSHFSLLRLFTIFAFSLSTETYKKLCFNSSGPLNNQRPLAMRPFKWPQLLLGLVIIALHLLPIYAQVLNPPYFNLAESRKVSLIFLV